MNVKRIYISVILLFLGFSAQAQRPIPDVNDESLKGSVRSLTTTVRTPQGRMVGQPVCKSYNYDGYLTQTVYLDTNKMPVLQVTYSYDGQHNLEKDIRTLVTADELLSQTTYEYDKKKRTLTAHMMGIADSMGQRTVYTYDKEQRLISVTTYDELDRLTTSTEYEYNDAGLKMRATYYEGENMTYKGMEKYRWDTDGFLAESCNYYISTLRQAFLYTYYYDVKGNWTQCYVFHVTPSEGYLYEIITREINYYE